MGAMGGYDPSACARMRTKSSGGGFGLSKGRRRRSGRRGGVGGNNLPNGSVCELCNPSRERAERGRKCGTEVRSSGGMRTGGLVGRAGRALLTREAARECVGREGARVS